MARRYFIEERCDENTCSSNLRDAFNHVDEKYSKGALSLYQIFFKCVTQETLVISSKLGRRIVK